MKTMLNKVEKFIKDSSANSENKNDWKHYIRTLYWVKRLNPKADLAILIAALTHDIERCFRDITSIERFKGKEWNDKKLTNQHSLTGAKIMVKFLKSQKCDRKIITEVYRLIRFHETGGDSKSDLIKDADSISYLENNVEYHIRLAPQMGKEKIKKKIDYMYNRISSKKAKVFATPHYQRATKLLNKYPYDS